MGQHTLDALYRAEVEEEYLYDYLEGYISDNDAYDFGLIDESGSLCNSGMEIAQSLPIMTLDCCKQEIEKLTLQLDLFIAKGANSKEELGSDKVCKKYSNRLRLAFPELNDAAIINLFKDNPTCNCCGNQMTEQHGKFGKFYFCVNKCTEQKNISESYWLKLKGEINV